MPTTKVGVALYRIDRCGYHKWGAEEPEFGEASTAFADLLSWHKGRPSFGDSCPYASEEQEDESRTFCFAVRHDPNSDEFLLTLWNESPVSDGRLASVALNSPAGAPRVQHINAPLNAITGFPTYFWVIPGKRLIATIRIGVLPAGRMRMEKYLRAFLARFAKSYVVTSDTDDELVILGYHDGSNAPTHADVRAQFRCAPVPDPQVIEYLRRNIDSIEAIVGKTEVSATSSVTGSTLRSLLEPLGIVRPRSLAETVQLRYDLTYRPSGTELEEMIASAAQGHNTETGFRIDNRTVWLKDAHLRIPLELSWSGEPENGRQLFAALRERRAEIIRRLR